MRRLPLGNRRMFLFCLIMLNKQKEGGDCPEAIAAFFLRLVAFTTEDK